MSPERREGDWTARLREAGAGAVRRWVEFFRPTPRVVPFRARVRVAPIVRGSEESAGE